jgi:hypothetical protein
MFTITSKTGTDVVDVLEVRMLKQSYRVCRYKIFIAQLSEAKIGL